MLVPDRYTHNEEATDGQNKESTTRGGSDNRIPPLVAVTPPPHTHAPVPDLPSPRRVVEVKNRRDKTATRGYHF